MAENHSKSRLKRKKSSVEDVPPKRSHTTLFSGDFTAGPERRSVVPAAAWWSRELPPAVEGLWALSLKSALPYLENQLWDLVPDLPHPPTARPTALKLDQQRWCDLSEDVAPFPEPSPPSQRTSLSPDLLQLGSSQQDLSAQTKPVSDPPDRRPSSHSRQSHNGKTGSLQALTKRRQPPLHSWEGAAAPAGPSSVGREEGWKGGEKVEEPGPVNRHLTNQPRVTDSRVSLQKEPENKEEVVEDEEEEEEEEVQRSIRGDGGGGGGGGGAALESCPMCLLVFPVGFTQMDCDGHLAQCLSEVNVDMTW